MELGAKSISSGEDVVLLRGATRAYAEALGLGPVDRTKLAVAVSEVARLVHSACGRATARFRIEEDRVLVVEVVGPGSVKEPLDQDDEPLRGVSGLASRVLRVPSGYRLEQALHGAPSPARLAELERRGVDGGQGPLEELREQNEALIATLEERRRIEARLALALETADLGIVSIDVNGDVEASRRASLLHGASLERTEDLASQLDEKGQPLRDGIEHLATGHLGVLETTYRAPSGRWVLLRARVEPSTHEIHATLLDVSRQKQEEEAQRRRAEVQQMMMGVASHDLRSPLQTIRTGATLLMEFDRIDDDARRVLRRIDQAGNQAARLVSDFFDYTQAQIGGRLPLRMEPCDLLEIAKGVAGSASLREGEAGVVAEGDPCPMEGDRVRLEQALTNLVDNALTHQAPSTEVRIRVRREPAARVVAVSNRGPEIPPELAERIFEPFERGQQPKRKGLGLGLHIVKLVVEAHGGTATVSSSSDGWTHFELRLPVDA